ncbi:polysaccharide pyruvyl transferase family protein [bacterium]|nr:polysaccharide pyruvyl transferase family protein [bacterium]
MKQQHPVILLLGNNSGRNLGDAAILSAILETVSQEMPDAEFLVPSITPKFIDEHYGDRYRVKGINCMPWTGSIRLFGIPTIRAIAKSDAALICDGIIFGKGFWNPAFNFLITLYALLPFFKFFRCKLICYNCGIGPFPIPASVGAARTVIESSDFVTLRDEDSKQLAEEIGVRTPLHVTGDSAFTNPVSSRERAAEIMRENKISATAPLLGINVTVYVDSWLKPEERVEESEKKNGKSADILLEQIAIAAGQLREAAGVEPVIFCTQPMDESTSRSLAEKLNAPMIDNSRYLSHDIQAVMRETQLLIGMRFHSLVLASAVDVPVVGMIYAPKVRGYLRLLRCPEYGLELTSIAEGVLHQKLPQAWSERAVLKDRQLEIVAGLTEGAEKAAKLLRNEILSDGVVVEREQPSSPV